MTKRHVIEFVGRTLLQAVSRRRLTSEVRVQSQGSPRTVYGGQSDTGASFPERFDFPPHSYNSIFVYHQDQTQVTPVTRHFYN